MKKLLALFAISGLLFAQGKPPYYADVNVSSGTTQLIAALTPNSIISVYKVSWTVPSGGTTVTMSLVTGVGSNCATSQTTLYGPVYLSTQSEDWQGAMSAPRGMNLCITTTGALGGGISYQQ